MMGEPCHRGPLRVRKLFAAHHAAIAGAIRLTAGWLTLEWVRAHTAATSASSLP